MRHSLRREDGSMPLGDPPRGHKHPLKRIAFQRVLLYKGLMEQSESFQEKGMGKGAYGCSFLGFIDSYRLLARTAAHSGCPGYVLLCTVADERKRHPAASGGLSEASERLEESIQEALGDEAAYLQYSRTQFLALLPRISREECQRRIGRIDMGFRRRENSRRVGVTYRMMQI